MRVNSSLESVEPDFLVEHGTEWQSTLPYLVNRASLELLVVCEEDCIYKLIPCPTGYLLNYVEGLYRDKVTEIPCIGGGGC